MTVFRETFRLLKHKNTLIAILVVLLIISLRGCYNNRVAIQENNDAWEQKIKMANDNASTMVKTINERNEEITTQKQLLVTEKQAKEMALLDNERLKKVKSKTKVVTRTEIKHVFIPYDSTITVHDTLIDSSYTASTFSVEDEWYTIKGISLIRGVQIDKISFKNELEHTVGYEPAKGIKRIWTKPTPIVEIHNKSPYTRTNEMYNFVIKPKKKRFYETKGFAFGVGIVGGLFLFK